jgi:putative spermidine/putrescine transport system ATP-binding protein
MVSDPSGTGPGIGASIRIRNLEKHFGDFRAVEGFSIDIAAGEFVSLLGASGSGKTTVLRMLAGLEEPTRGQILIDGRDATSLPPEARAIGLVFQDYALFPHMSVADNIAFPLRMRRMPRAEIAGEVDRILAMVGAETLRARRPSQLSGGQQQRIALARALVFKPKLLLLDEPLSALDKNLREHMKAEIKAIHRRTGVTVIYVTHDQSEALALSDRIVVMRAGRIIDADAPERLYGLPSSAYLAGFIGDANLVGGSIAAASESGIEVSSALGCVPLPGTQLRLAGAPNVGQRITLVIRPENILVEPPPEMAGLLRVGCRIDEMLYSGSHTIYSLTTTGSRLALTARCGLHPIGKFAPGAAATIGVRIDRSVAVPDAPEQIE